MTRAAKNRRRRAPLHPATSGSFHPIQVDSNGVADCKTNGSVEKGDHVPVDNPHSQQHAVPNPGNQRPEDPQIGKKGVNGRRSQGHINSTCPHHHHHQQHPKRDGKDNSDLRKILVSKHQAAAEDGKYPSKPQEFTPYMAARAKELKEEGNRLFQKKEYSNAMEQYELALKLTPLDHPDRAIFHSNRAACLMQMKPILYEAAINECNLALHAQPGFPRALLRRARAFEATGNLELALEDVELLLQGDVGHPDAVELARRIRVSLTSEGNEAGNKKATNEGRQDDEGMQPTPVPAPDVKSDSDIPANARVASREVPSVLIPEYSDESEVNACDEDDHGALLTPVPSSRRMQQPPCSFPQPTRFQPTHTPVPEVFPSTSSHEASPNVSPCDAHHANMLPSSDPYKSESLKKVIHQDSIQIQQIEEKVPSFRPLKLIYDHDIRLAEMPVDCKFGDLRKLVKERFPASKSILMKYKDAEGDLVTITSTQDLRLAEAAAAIDVASRSFRMAGMDAFSQGQHKDSAIGLPVVPSTLDQLRLHVVEVPADQEPYDKNEVYIKAGDSEVSTDRLGKTNSFVSEDASRGDAKSMGKDDFDNWLLDFAQLFRSHLGIDPNGHIDLHERGMELCAEALEEAASTEEAIKLFTVAASKFQEMTALGFLNWGNVYMCAARKQLPHNDTDDEQLDFCDRLQAAFDWAQAQYALAEQKFAESIHAKPDFCDAMLSLGQKDFESAKLHWSLAVAKQTDLSLWDSSEMLKLFHKAEETMEKAARLLEKQGYAANHRKSAGEVVQIENAGDSEVSGNTNGKISAFGQDVGLKSQVYLFWGNILYEHSQVMFRLGLPLWKELLNAAVEKFEVAGASSQDISTALEKHLSNSLVFLDAGEGTVQECDSSLESNKVVNSEKYPTLPNSNFSAEDGIEEKYMGTDRDVAEDGLPEVSLL